MGTRSTHAAAWALLVLAAVVLWPRAWGGAMTYVLTTGTSMSPTFAAGDLAVLRTADSYRVGDVLAYRSEELDRVVLHRVRTAEDGVFTLQGDGNDFVDPDRVREQQVLGRLALRVPNVGPVLSWLLQPVNLVLAGGALLLLLGDRRKPLVPPAGPLEVTVRGVHLSGATLVDLVDDADLARLAAQHDRPVLRHEDSGTRWVLHGSTAYRHAPPVAPAQDVGAGRDWQYGLDPDVVAVLPRPRRAAPEPTHGVDLGRLLRLR